MKKVVALILVAVMCLGLAATALAAVPKVTLPNSYRNQIVRRGRTIGWTFHCYSQSYGLKYYSGRGWYYRSEFDMQVTKGSTTYAYSYNNWFSGSNVSWRKTWKVPKNAKTGNFTMRWQVYYRSNGLSRYLYRASSNSCGFYVLK